jgi:anthranilate synthase/aminodeoxychorismate synthase-like glutamine amidotransferase
VGILLRNNPVATATGSVPDCLPDFWGKAAAQFRRQIRNNDQSEMLLVIDNYDSFTYNLVQYLGELGEGIKVRRNNEVTLDEIESELKPSRILISPGPGTPDDAGISLKVIDRFAGKVPILGVCLGHQAIGQVFGGRVVRALELCHGKSSPVHHDGKTIFAGLDQSFAAGRYHSLIVEDKSLPSCLEVSARTPDGIIMGLRHRELKVEGVQFHPESIMTLEGKKLLANFLKL